LLRITFKVVVVEPLFDLKLIMLLMLRP